MFVSPSLAALLEILPFEFSLHRARKASRTDNIAAQAPELISVQAVVGKNTAIVHRHPHTLDRLRPPNLGAAAELHRKMVRDVLLIVIYA
jgi:hypothetical protein